MIKRATVRLGSRTETLSSKVGSKASMVEFDLLVPESVDAALAALQGSPDEPTVVLAGGTDLLLDLDEGRITARRVISLRHLPWRDLAWENGGLRIGSTLPLSELDGDARLRREIPGLWEAVHAVGGVALRHRATIGGNLARAAPASDLLPVLLALDASVEILGKHGSRSIPLDGFLRASRSTTLGPTELIRSVVIPETRPSEYLWQRVRPANDISQVGVAVARSQFEPHWRIALGGVTPRTMRILEAEQALPAVPSDEAIETAARHAAARATFSTDKRATEEYRRLLVGTLVTRAVRTVRSQRASSSAPEAAL
jgi:CO/xanthine dehydrogenase FAD-binding subunit